MEGAACERGRRNLLDRVSSPTLRVADAVGQRCLAGPPHAGEPGDGRFLPGVLDALHPKGTWDHVGMISIFSE
mgnify:CR=1 FL=1